MLGAGGHTSGRPRALYINQYGRDFGEIGQPQELVHERKTRATGGRECPRSVPVGTNDHADSSQFVFRLDNRYVALPRFRVFPVFLAVVHKRLHGGGGRGDRVPGGHRGTSVHRAEGTGGVAVHEDGIANGVPPFHAKVHRAGEMLAGIGYAHLQRLDIGLYEALLTGKLLG